MRKDDTFKPVEIDLTYLKKVSRNNPITLQNLLKTYLKELPVAISKIQNSVNQKNSLEFKCTIHSLKTGLKMFGLVHLVEYIAEIENQIACSTFLFETEQSKIEEFLNILDQLIKQIELKLQ